jgi:hypothetical protein
MTDPCDSGNCLQVDITGDLWETSQPGIEVVTTLASWRQVLKANQMPDGGEWRTETGRVEANGSQRWPDSWEPNTHQRRVWYGPVEPIAED